MPSEDDVPLPKLQDATLDQPAITAWFDDVATCAELLEIVVRGGKWADEPVAATKENARERLDSALRALLGGASVQLRYRFEGTEWWDTIMPVAEGKFRLVRIDRGAIGAAR